MRFIRERWRRIPPFPECQSEESSFLRLGLKTGELPISAENLGTNNTLVFDGTVNAKTGNLPGPGNTRQFDYVFPFTTPFLYDPAAGNLVLDLQIEASGSGVTFDTVSGESGHRGSLLFRLFHRYHWRHPGFSRDPVYL
jgi:hypothetical protein